MFAAQFRPGPSGLVGHLRPQLLALLEAAIVCSGSFNSCGLRTNEVGSMEVREVVANVQNLHRDESTAGSLFQVASFNLLEMGSPSVTPEAGVGIYENDHTQGPACAIAAGAGTIYRNYFALVKGHRPIGTQPNRLPSGSWRKIGKF